MWNSCRHCLSRIYSYFPQTKTQEFRVLQKGAGAAQTFISVSISCSDQMKDRADLSRANSEETEAVYRKSIFGYLQKSEDWNGWNKEMFLSISWPTTNNIRKKQNQKVNEKYIHIIFNS